MKIQYQVKGKTNIIVDEKYNFNSKRCFLDRNLKEFKSSKKSNIIYDNLNNI